MLKNKKAIYVLIPLNIAIWSFFAYRIYKGFTDSDVMEISESQSNVKSESIKDSAVYKLSLDYKDPFLKETERPKHYNAGQSLSSNGSQKKLEQTVTIKTPSVTPKLPDIKYLGLIKNSSSGVITALVSINGQSKLVKLNEVIDGVIFKSFNNTELIALMGKEKIIVKK